MSDNHGEPDTSGHPSGHLRPAPEPPATPPPDGSLPLSAVFPVQAVLPHDVVTYGPDIADESSLRLLGSVEGKRVLLLGGAAAEPAVALARLGAHVIAVDPSHRVLDRVRTACEREEVKAELHQSDLAELAFVRADTVDLVLSIYALASVGDLDRVFRQAHRVLRTGAHLVFSLPHPAFAVARGRSYFDTEPVVWRQGETEGREHPHTISEIFGGLIRANFRIDALLEPAPADSARSGLWQPAMATVPATLVVRARKEGL